MADASIKIRPIDNQPSALTILRIALGLLLLWKSINFIRNTTAAQTLIEQTRQGFFTNNSAVIAFVVSYLGLLCGIFITVGLFTRAASIIQIPILIVAVFFINIRNINSNIVELLLSLIALILLILFAIKGSGPLSADEYFRRGAAQDALSKGQIR